MNRIIVVTGGAGGIGRCIVAHFASQGDSVYFIDHYSLIISSVILFYK